MKIVGYLALIVGAVIVLPLVGVLSGAFVGWAVSLFGFAPLILDFLRRIGVDTAGLELWQVGAALGFLGAFFRSPNFNQGKS